LLAIRAPVRPTSPCTRTRAYPVDVDDHDGRFLDDTRLSIRAFKQGRDVILWILNDTSTSFTGKTIRIPGEAIIPSAAPTFTRWTGSRDLEP
jgi:hypothetical protein